MSKNNHPRILVVDDIRDAADSMVLLLDLWGYVAKVSYDGPAALETARLFYPQLVLLDLGMPGMDGFEVARRLRAEEPEPANLVLIAISGYADAAHRARARLAGFDHYLVKPADLDHLREVLGRVPAWLRFQTPERIRELQEAVS